MRARLPREVDQLGGFAHGAHRRFRHGFRRSRQRNDAAVMVDVALVGKHEHVRHFADGGENGLDLGRIATFGKIRNAFNERFHLEWITTPRFMVKLQRFTPK